jgi:peptidyl-prolyl cis-trans isomerase C
MTKRLLPLILVFVSSCALAQDDGAARVIAERGDVRLTFGNFDALVAKLPNEERPALVANENRMRQMIDSELLQMQLANRGRSLGLDQDDLTKRVMQRAADAALAELTLAKMVEQAMNINLEQLAKENYLANQEAYMSSLYSKAQHVLVSLDGRSDAEAAARAAMVMAKAKAGEPFAALVQEYSDDSGKALNNGIVEMSEANQYGDYQTAAEALEKVGAVSDVTRDASGYYVIKLLERKAPAPKPFESIKDELIAQLNTEFRDKTKARIFSDFRAANPQTDEAAVQDLKKRYGELPAIPALTAPSEQQ